MDDLYSFNKALLLWEEERDKILWFLEMSLMFYFTKA